MKIQSSDINRRMSEETLISPASALPNELRGDIQPVLISNKRITANIIRGANKSATGSVVVYTTPSDRDFYLTSLNTSYVASVLCDNANGAIIVTEENGSVLGLFVYQKLILTAGAETFIQSFPTPVKLQRNSTINLSGTFTVGTLNQSATITGFTTSKV